MKNISRRSLFTFMAGALGAAAAAKVTEAAPAGNPTGYFITDPRNAQCEQYVISIHQMPLQGHHLIDPYHHHYYSTNPWKSA